MTTVNVPKMAFEAVQNAIRLCNEIGCVAVDCPARGPLEMPSSLDPIFAFPHRFAHYLKIECQSCHTPRILAIQDRLLETNGLAKVKWWEVDGHKEYFVTEESYVD